MPIFYYVRNFFGKYEWSRPFFIAYLFGNKKIISKSHDLVVEGYARSGNSFFYNLIKRRSQKKDILIAHHLHVPFQINLGAQWNVPVVCLVRDPLSCVASNIVASGGTLSVNMGLWSYIRFFRSIKKSKDKVLFLDFKEIIDKPVAALAQISGYSEITFNLAEFSDQEEAELFDKLKRHNKEQKQSSELAAIPDEGRKLRSEAIKESLKRSNLYLTALREYETALELCKNNSSM